MAIIDTALVSNGNLLIQLDDGTVVNAGRVAGPQGPPGRDGQDGAPGIPGAKGDPGENGAKWHTGVGAPDIGLGNAGDLYMDVANALLPIFQKVGRDWIFLANLKPPAAGASGGGGGAAGGGGSVIIHPGPQPPTTDNDNRPIQEGDLWVDINGNHLYVYYNGVWSEVTTCSVGGGSSDGDFLKRYGDKVTDATEHTVYEWNEGVRFRNEMDSHIDITQGIEIQANGTVDVYGTGSARLSGSGGTALVASQSGTRVVAASGDVVLEAGDVSPGNELIERTITASAPGKQITNKEYVDSLFDFSQYPELT